MGRKIRRPMHPSTRHRVDALCTPGPSCKHSGTRTTHQFIKVRLVVTHTQQRRRRQHGRTQHCFQHGGQKRFCTPVVLLQRALFAALSCMLGDAVEFFFVVHNFHGVENHCEHGGAIAPLSVDAQTPPSDQCICACAICTCAKISPSHRQCDRLQCRSWRPPIVCAGRGRSECRRTETAVHEAR